ncbi:putative Ulp1 protease family catalytic domain, papain-like cysteine peptidase superfamily [Helianthus anomalus]
MDLKEYRNLIFPILERSHFYLVCFVLKNMAITVIDNMHQSESPVKVVNNNDFFLKSTLMKVVSVYCRTIRKGNYEDCGVYAMRHMEAWMGII